MSEDRRPGQTLADYVTIVLSPVLVMGLVGSLVFFLLEILYRADGPWKGRLQWILFFYVFGSVLTARISMMGEIAGRARLYGLALAVATYVGMQAYVDMPETLRPVSFAVNLLLILVVWWCVHRLVWDCTNVDESTDMNAAGLLQVTGLESKPPAPDEEVVEAEEEPAGRKKLSGFDLWFWRYRRYRERQGKKRSLGAWVVYFSLAALPIFGLGQALIPVEAGDRRRSSFWLMAVYVGCGLGLLLTTCFLSLRRYLRQKNLQMPAAMTRAWLLVGGGLIAGLLVVAAVLPRPYSETSLIDLARGGSAKRQASAYSPKGDSPGEGEGKNGTPQADPKARGDLSADNGKGTAKGEKQGRGEKQGDKGKGKQARNQEKSNDPAGKKAGERTEAGKTTEAMKKAENAAQPSRSNRLAEVLQKVGPWLKWLVFAVLVVVVVGALLRGGLGFLANFTDWARRLLRAWQDFWAGLLGEKKKEEGVAAADAEEAESPRPALPFSAFANPFSSGKADRIDLPELVRYTFEALEAWARERDCGRGPGETALEFIGRLGEELPTLEQEAARLGELHARVEYGRGALPGGAKETVRRFWERLERVTHAPLSA